jgi:hypothetical protein
MEQRKRTGVWNRLHGPGFRTSLNTMRGEKKSIILEWKLFHDSNSSALVHVCLHTPETGFDYL